MLTKIHKYKVIFWKDWNVMILLLVETIPSAILKINWQTQFFCSFFKCHLLKSYFHMFLSETITGQSDLQWQLNEDLITCLDNSHLLKSEFPVIFILIITFYFCAFIGKTPSTNHFFCLPPERYLKRINKHIFLPFNLEKQRVLDQKIVTRKTEA